MIIYILQATNTECWFDKVFLFSTEEEAEQFAIEHNYEDYQIYPRTLGAK